MNLWEYAFKNVKVKLKTGEELECYVDLYTSENDNDPPVESICVLPDKSCKTGVEIYADRIESIELV